MNFWKKIVSFITSCSRKRKKRKEKKQMEERRFLWEYWNSYLETNIPFKEGLSQL